MIFIVIIWSSIEGIMSFSALVKTLTNNLTKEQCKEMAKLMGVKEPNIAQYAYISNFIGWLDTNYNWKTGTTYLDLNDISLLRTLLSNKAVGAANLVQYVDQYLPFEQNVERSKEYSQFKKTICQNLSEYRSKNAARLVGIPADSVSKSTDLFTELERRCYICREDVSQLRILFRHPGVKSNYFNFEKLIYDYDAYTMHYDLATKVTIDPYISLKVSVADGLTANEIVKLNQMVCVDKDTWPYDLLTQFETQGHISPNNLTYLKTHLTEINAADVMYLINKYESEFLKDVQKPPQILCNQLSPAENLPQNASHNPPKNSPEGKQLKVDCVVCFAEERDIVLIPCGHICVCSECSNALTTCPMCFKNIITKQRFYVS